MPRLQRKSFATPDQVRTFATGHLDIVALDEAEVGRYLFQPGWRWSKDVAPITGTRSCQHRHLGHTISGSVFVRMDDGTELVIGPSLRVGVHTSEVEIVGGQARGVGVHTAARVASLAGADEVLVSGTTRDLLDGSGLVFDSRGEHELKGLSGARPICALRR